MTTSWLIERVIKIQRTTTVLLVIRSVQSIDGLLASSKRTSCLYMFFFLPLKLISIIFFFAWFFYIMYVKGLITPYLLIWGAVCIIGFSLEYLWPTNNSRQINGFTKTLLKLIFISLIFFMLWERNLQLGYVAFSSFFHAPQIILRSLSQYMGKSLVAPRFGLMFGQQ